MDDSTDPASLGDAPNSGLGQIVGFLTNVKTVVGLVAAIMLAAVPIVQNACILPLVSLACRASQTGSGGGSTTSPLTEADIDQKVAALGVSRDISLENVNLVVHHQEPSGDPLVVGVLVGLRAAGFNVGINLNEAQTNLANVLNVDRTPGMVWVKSVAARKALRETARAAILKALPASYDHVKVSDADIADSDPETIRRAGEIQVDVF